MSAPAKPVVVLSRCLELDACRYNGQRIPDSFVRQLEPFVEYVPTCPEVEIGLGTPRDPIRLVSLGGRTRLVQPATERDVTEDMSRFSDSFLDSLQEVDGFILKSRSPSCGIKDVKIYPQAGGSGLAAKGAGLFAAKVLERYAELAVEDEGRLTNYRIREHFLTKLFRLAELRRVEDSCRMKELVAFHSRNKFVLMAYNQKEMRNLGRIVANHERASFDEVMASYRHHLGLALRQLPRYTSVINVLEHVSGYFSRRLEGHEKDFFRASLQSYREGRIPVSALTSVLRVWAIRFQIDYLLEQTLFRPYPEELMSLRDSGKGRAE